ncbi:MAG: MarR family transcriptional regulator [Dyella sp.]
MNSKTAPALCQPDNLGMLLAMVRTEIVKAVEAELSQRGLDLRFTQFLILRRLDVLGPMGASELARVVELDGGAMTRQLDQLEARGVLRRVPHEQDRRALRIELTAPGKVLCKSVHECAARVIEESQKQLNPTERVQLQDYLERVLHTLRNKD